MADQAPFCIHCGAQQLNADSRFCHRCGQPIVPVKPGRGKAAPWLAPVLVSTAIVVVAAVVLASVLSRGPTASKPTAGAPTKAVQSQAVQVTPTTVAAAPEIITPLPPTPAETPQPSATLANITPEPVKLTRLAWSPDGKLLAIGSATGVYIYDTSTWQEIRFIPLKVGAASSSRNGARNVVFSFDSALLGTEGDEIVVWRVTDGSFAYTLKGQQALAASPAEGLWATLNVYVGGPGRLQLWRTNDGQLERALPTGREHGILRTIAFSSDGQLIATAAAETDGFVVSRVADGTVLSKAPENTLWEAFGVDLAFRPGTSIMAYVASDDLLGLWDAKTGALIRQLNGPNDMTKSPVIYRVAFAPDGGSFATLRGAASGAEGGTVQIWLADGSQGQSWPLAAAAGDLAFSSDSSLLAVLTGQSVFLYDPSDGSVVHQVEPVWHQGILPSLTATPDVVGLRAPTATSHAAALSIPIDWKAYDPPEGAFSIRYPPYWDIGGWGPENIEFVPGSYLDFDPASSLIVAIQLLESCAIDASSDEEMKRRLLQTEDEYLALLFGPGGYNDRTPLGSGRWTTLIQGFYAEFDITFEPGDSRVVRELRLLAVPAADHCVLAILLDDPGDISEQTRLDLAQVVGSIKYKDR